MVRGKSAIPVPFCNRKIIFPEQSPPLSSSSSETSSSLEECRFLQQYLSRPDYAKAIQGAMQLYHYLNTLDNGRRPVYRSFLTRNLYYLKIKVKDDEAEYFPLEPHLVTKLMGLMLKKEEEKEGSEKERDKEDEKEQQEDVTEERKVTEEEKPKEKKWRERSKTLHCILEKLAGKRITQEVNCEQRVYDPSIPPIIDCESEDKTDEKEGVLAGVVVRKLSYELVEQKHEADRAVVYIEEKEDSPIYDDSSSTLTDKTRSVTPEDIQDALDMRGVADMNLEESDSQTESDSVESCVKEEPQMINADYETVARVLGCKAHEFLLNSRLNEQIRARLSLKLPEKIRYQICLGRQRKRSKKSEKEDKLVFSSVEADSTSSCPICHKSFDNMFTLLLHCNLNYPQLAFVLDIGTYADCKKKLSKDRTAIVKIYLNPYYEEELEIKLPTGPSWYRDTDPVYLMNKYSKREVYKRFRADMSVFLEPDNLYHMADNLFPAGSYYYVTQNDGMRKRLSDKYLEGIGDKEYPPPGYGIAIEIYKKDLMSIESIAALPYARRRFMMMWNDMRVRLGERFSSYIGAYMCCRLFLITHWKEFRAQDFRWYAIETMHDITKYDHISAEDFIDLCFRVISIRCYGRLVDYDPLYIHGVSPLWCALDECLTELRENYKEKLEKTDDIELPNSVTKVKEPKIPRFVKELEDRVLTPEEKTELFVAEFDNEDFFDTTDLLREHRADPIEKFFDGKFPSILIDARREAPFHLPDIHNEMKNKTKTEEDYRREEERLANSDMRKLYDATLRYATKDPLINPTGRTSDVEDYLDGYMERRAAKKRARTPPTEAKRQKVEEGSSEIFESDSTIAPIEEENTV